jgi:hypothetical protein
MTINQKVYVRINGELKIGKVEEIRNEDLIVQLDTGELIERKFWEIAKLIE